MVRLLSLLALACCVVSALGGCDMRKPDYKTTEEHRYDCLNATDFNGCRMKAEQQGSYPIARPGHK